MDDNTKNAKPFFSIFSHNRELIIEIMQKLSNSYGEIDMETDFLSFNQTNYYEKEFWKQFRKKNFFH